MPAPRSSWLIGIAPVAEVAMIGALHDGLRARELDVGAEPFRGRKIGGADQEKAELRLAQRLVELGVGASLHVEREGVLSLLDHVVGQRVVAGVGPEGGGDSLVEIGLVLRSPELLAEAAIEIAERLAHQRVRAGLAELGLERLDQGHQDLRLDPGLFDDGYAHGRPSRSSDASLSACPVKWNTF